MATRSANKDIEKLLEEVGRLDGWRVEDRGGTGWRVFPPAPARPMTVTHGPRNPTRSYRNTIAKLRRAGAPL